jgi:hypothetical protein
MKPENLDGFTLPREGIRECGWRMEKTKAVCSEPRPLWKRIVGALG